MRQARGGPGWRVTRQSEVDFALPWPKKSRTHNLESTCLCNVRMFVPPKARRLERDHFLEDAGGGFNT